MTKASKFPVDPSLSSQVVPDVPGCRVSYSTQYDTTTASTWVVEWDTLDWDTDGFTDIGGANPEQITIPSGLAGWYQVSASVAMEANATGRRIFDIETPSTGNRLISSSLAPLSSGVARTNLSGLLYLDEGDSIQLSAYQDSGGNLEFGVAGTYADLCWFGVSQVMPANVIVPPRTSSGQSHQIVTSSTRPSVKWDGLMIYETDTKNTLVWNDAQSAWQQPWNQPWGIIAYQKLTSNSGSFTTLAEIITTDAVDLLAGRSYAVSCTARIYQSGAGSGAQNVVAYADTTGLATTSMVEAGATKTVTHQITDVLYEPSSDETIDFSLWAGATSSSLLVNTATGPSYIMVKDVGPAL